MAVSAGAPAVFFDKDGTLVEDVPFNVDPRQVHLAPGATMAARRLHEAGYRLFIVSNQPGIAQGRFEESALAPVLLRLRNLLGVPLAGIYYCPHHAQGSVARYAHACQCRKPAPGMLLRAARTHGLNLSGSWLVGDILDDIEAGRRAGCGTILIDNGNETEWRTSAMRTPHVRVGDLRQAAAEICARHASERIA